MYSKKQRLGVIFCFILILNSCSLIENKRENIHNKERKAIPVKVLKVDYAQTNSSSTYIATARSSQISLISTRNSGTITSFNLKRGDRIAKDQIIAVIDSPNIKSSNEIAQATLRRAEDGYRRAQSVFESGSISEQKMVEVQTQYDQALAAAAASENALKNCTIVSPFDAFVEEIYVDDGQDIDAPQNIVKLVNINDIELEFSVPETEIAQICEGQKISFDVPALDLFNLEASVSSKGVSASALSHSYTCVASLNKQIEGLLPGMVCKARLINTNSSMDIIIPSSVLLLDTEGRYLWVVENGVAKKRRVEVGSFSAQGIKITKGLNSQDEIIIEGYQKVSSNMKVEVVE